MIGRSASGPRVRPVGIDDAAEWERLRQALWPSAAGEHAREIADFFGGETDRPAEAWLAFDESGRAVGLAEAAIRRYAEECTSGRVAYLEGWYVDPRQRRRGVGRALIAALEAWARAQGCSELGSDTALTNEVGYRAHRALGFEETARIVCFRRELPVGARSATGSASEPEDGDR